MNKTISCLLTTHNKEFLIDRVCYGIKNNISELVKEIIVVFDGCVDKTEEIVKHSFGDLNINVKYVYTPDVFEIKSNNEGLKNVTSDYVVLIQDDMVVKEKDFDKRMLKPFLEFDDVFAVTSQTAHDNQIHGQTLHHTNLADRRFGASRNTFYVREIANRGPLMYNYSDLEKLNFLDEDYVPTSYDDHDISYRAFKKLNKVSGLYWIDYESNLSWGTSRIKKENNHIYHSAHNKNSGLIIERHKDIIGSIISESRILN